MIKTFSYLQARLKIPPDPDLWTQTHVKHWLQWAVRQFNLKKLRLSDWNITGAELCALELPQFQAKVPEDPGDVFWTHLQLLKKCKFVGELFAVLNDFFFFFKPVVKYTFCSFSLPHYLNIFILKLAILFLP